MKKSKKMFAIVSILIFTLLFSVTCFADNSSSNSVWQTDGKQQSEKLLSTGQPANYTTYVYGKNLEEPESEKFSTIKECFAWIKGRNLNGIVYLDSNPKKVVGVELEGCEIDFGANYILKYDGKKLIYDKKVLSVQKALDSLGFKLKCDGCFGKHTSDAVRQFQRSVRLEADGVVGVKTYEKLTGSFQTKNTAKTRSD